MNQDLIDNAISFLSSPNVSSSSKQKKIAFLESKGLTKEEIDAAFDAVKDISHSSWTSWLFGAIVLGSLSYTAFIYAKHYIEEFLNENEEKQKAANDKVDRALKEMKISSDLQLKNMDHQIKILQESIRRLERQASRTEKENCENNEHNENKNDLNLTEEGKAILSERPIIPKWQLE